MAGAGGVVDLHLDWADPRLAQRLARRLAELGGSRIGLITSEGGGAPFFAVFAGPESGLEAASLGPQVAEALGGRGGGAAGVYQGKAEAMDRRPEA